MAGRRKDLKVNQLLDQYLRKSKDLDSHLEDIKAEVAEHNQRIEKQRVLAHKLSDLAGLIEDAECSIDGLRERYHDASFRGDEHALTTIQHQRTSLLSAIQGYKKEIADTQAELESVPVDHVAIGELAATLQAGITVPNHAEVVRVIQDELKKLASEQERKLKELRSSVPSQFSAQAAYDAKMKELNPRYKSDAERREESERFQAERAAKLEEERRTLDQGPKSPSERAKANRANEARAAKPAVEAATAW